MSSITETAVLEYRDVSVTFGPTHALSDISFSVSPGEIVGLLGHNGAGKSTLFNVTSGAIAASSGTFRINGYDVGAKLAPREAADHGIAIIHQEPALAQNLSVLDNLYLARRSPKGTNRREEAHRALRRVGADVSLDIPVEALSQGQRQLVDIARGTLAGDMKILLLDEPTAALGKSETEALHRLIQDFAAQGVAVIYVSHRLPDILEVCTRITVLRAGTLTVDGPSTEFTPDILAKALVPELRKAEVIDTTVGSEVLRFERSSGSVSARAGEVVGLFGMAGGEQFDLAASLGGAGRPAEFELQGDWVKMGNPSQAMRRRVFFVPPDRDRDGLIATETAKDNVLLPWYDRAYGGWWISERAGREVYGLARNSLDISGPAGNAEISQFSGGNRQKHLLARWLYPFEPTLLVLSQPTQGVDVGAKLDIVDAVRTAAQNGATVLVASSESDEIASMCDRSYIFAGGQQSHLQQSDDFNSALLSGLLSLAASLAD